MRTVEDIIVEREHISEELEEYRSFDANDPTKNEFLKKAEQAKTKIRALDIELNRLSGAADKNKRVGDKRSSGAVADPRISKKRRY